MTRVAPVYAANSFQFQFEPPLRDPERIVSLDDIQLAYDQRTVLNQVSLTLSRGDRLAVIGVNGAGKTTLVKMLAGELAPSAGRRSAGREIVVGYFAQHQIETLPAEATPLKLLARHFPQEREQALRDFLGRFGFHGEAAERPIGPLSGGEKSRLALAVLVRQRPNLLLLDEPTNHLDLEMRRSLAMALQGYEGALVIVSHDRHLLATCADRILVVEAGQVREFDGDLEDYRKARLKEERAQRADSPRGTRKDLRRESAEQRAALTRQLKPLEKAVASAETLIAQRQNDLTTVRAVLADNALYSEENKARLKQTLAQEARIQSELAHAEEDWLHASARLDAARDELTKSDATAD
jgi:ATP-binding cassette subfamily F protein 3